MKSSEDFFVSVLNKAGGGIGLPIGYRRKEAPEVIERRLQEAEDLAMMIGERTLAEGLAWAKPGLMLSRPATIPMENDALAWHLTMDNRARCPRASKEIASDFWRWRDTVLHREDDDTGKALAVLRTAVQCSAVRDGRGNEVARLCVEFLEQHFGRAIGASFAPARLPFPLPREEGDELMTFRHLARSLVRREATMPTWLLWFGALPMPRSIRLRPPPGSELDQALQGEVVGEGKSKGKAGGFPSVSKRSEEWGG